MELKVIILSIPFFVFLSLKCTIDYMKISDISGNSSINLLLHKSMSIEFTVYIFALLIERMHKI